MWSKSGAWVEHCPGLLEHHDIQSEQKDRGEQEGKEEHGGQEAPRGGFRHVQRHRASRDHARA